MVVGAAEALDPLRRLAVLLRALGAGDLPVGDVAQEHVGERPLALALDRGAALAGQEALALERVQERRRLRSSRRSAPVQKTLPTTDGILEQRPSPRPRGRRGGRRRSPAASREAAGPPPSRARGRAARTARRRAGCPPTRSSSACWISAGSSERSSTCEMRRAVCSAESGESPIVEALSLPPPQPGRRSRSSGRALQTTRSGTSLSQSTSSSTKSSRPSSAQCRSSSTRTSGRCSASASRKRRQAANASPRRSPPRPVSVSSPTSGRRCDSTQRASRRVGERVLDRRVQLLGRLRLGVPLEDARLRLDDLRERPERDAVAVGEAAPLAPGDELGVGVDDLRELVDEPALAHPRDGDERDELRDSLVARALEGVAQDDELALAADELGARVVGDVDAEARAGCRSPPRPGSARPCPWPRRQALRAYSIVCAGRAVGRLVDEDAVDRGGALQAGGRVDDVAGGHPLALGRAARRARRAPRRS